MRINEVKIGESYYLNPLFLKERSFTACAHGLNSRTLVKIHSRGKSTFYVTPLHGENILFWANARHLSKNPTSPFKGHSLTKIFK